MESDQLETSENPLLNIFEVDETQLQSNFDEFFKVFELKLEINAVMDVSKTLAEVIQKEKNKLSVTEKQHKRLVVNLKNLSDRFDDMEDPLKELKVFLQGYKVEEVRFNAGRKECEALEKTLNQISDEIKFEKGHLQILGACKDKICRNLEIESVILKNEEDSSLKLLSQISTIETSLRDMGDKIQTNKDFLSKMSQKDFELNGFMQKETEITQLIDDKDKVNDQLQAEISAVEIVAEEMHFQIAALQDSADKMNMESMVIAHNLKAKQQFCDSIVPEGVDVNNLQNLQLHLESKEFEPFEKLSLEINENLLNVENLQKTLEILAKEETAEGTELKDLQAEILAHESTMEDLANQKSTLVQHTEELTEALKVVCEAEEENQKLKSDIKTLECEFENIEKNGEIEIQEMEQKIADLTEQIQNEETKRARLMDEDKFLSTDQMFESLRVSQIFNERPAKLKAKSSMLMAISSDSDD